jgi:zona occludens toxin
VPKIKVKETFVAEINADGEWVIPAHLVDAVFAIDEVHDFYVSSRQPLPPDQENFFALHGQFGMDGVILTQAINRAHSAVKLRIERKNVFQKLTAVGMEGKCKVRRYHAVAPGKFELVNTEIFTYDATYFPFYKGYGGGAEQKGVYKAGGSTVWKRFRPYALVIIPMVALGVWGFLRVFHGDGGLVKEAPRMGAAPKTVMSAPADKPAPVASPSLPTSQHPQTVDTKGMPPEVAYVFSMSGQARARLAAVLKGDHGEPWGLVEWREDQGHVLERLSLAQLRELGLAVEVRSYGVKLRWKDKSIIVTAWPVDMPGTVAQANQQAPAASAPAQPPSDAQATDWGRQPIATAYIPPELVKSSGPSTWKPGG